jgi:lysozyme
MAWDDREKQELTLDEGSSLTAYKDNLGNWTIGIGHYLGTDKAFGSLNWTQDQVNETFEDDFAVAEDEARTVFPSFDGLDGARKGALVNMAFQLGESSLRNFTTFLHYLDLGKYEEAALDLMNTRYARQVQDRAKRIAYRIRTGDYAQR